MLGSWITGVLLQVSEGVSQVLSPHEQRERSAHPARYVTCSLYAHSVSWIRSSLLPPKSTGCRTSIRCIWRKRCRKVRAVGPRNSGCLCENKQVNEWKRLEIGERANSPHQRDWNEPSRTRLSITWRKDRHTRSGSVLRWICAKRIAYEPKYLLCEQ